MYMDMQCILYISGLGEKALERILAGGSSRKSLSAITFAFLLIIFTYVHVNLAHLEY